MIAVAGLGVFAYFQSVSLKDNQRQVQELTAKLEASSKAATANAKAADIALQDRCAKRAREEFKDLGWETEPLASFTNHYNQALNKCFLLIQSQKIDTKNGVINENRNLSDAFERKTFGEYMRSTADGKKYWEAIPFICDVTLPSGEVMTCSSPQQFEELIKRYME